MQDSLVKVFQIPKILLIKCIILCMKESIYDVGGNWIFSEDGGGYHHDKNLRVAGNEEWNRPLAVWFNPEEEEAVAIVNGVKADLDEELEKKHLQSRGRIPKNYCRVMHYRHLNKVEKGIIRKSISKIKRGKEKELRIDVSEGKGEVIFVGNRQDSNKRALEYVKELKNNK